MTTEQREAIDRLNRFKTIQVLYGNTFAMHIEQLKTLQVNINTVLSLIKEQQEEIEKKDKIIDFYKKGLEREVESNRENVMEIIKKDKQIDYIIDFIRERSIYAVDTHEKLKQYFADKVNSSEQN